MDIFEMKQIEMNESEWLEDVRLSDDGLSGDGMLKMQVFVRRVPGGWIYEYVTVRCEKRRQQGEPPVMAEVEVTAMSATFVPTPVPVSSW